MLVETLLCCEAYLNLEYMLTNEHDQFASNQVTNIIPSHANIADAECLD